MLFLTRAESRVVECQKGGLRLKAERKSKSKARRRAKRKEAKREAERRAEVRKVELNQRKQTLPERDQAVKRQNLNASDDNGWKDKPRKLRNDSKSVSKTQKEKP